MGYSFAGVGEATTVWRRLYDPAPSFDGRLVFAGEHTSANFTGYMEGALRSGERAARALLAVAERRRDAASARSSSSHAPDYRTRPCPEGFK